MNSALLCGPCRAILLVGIWAASLVSFGALNPAQAVCDFLPVEGANNSTKAADANFKHLKDCLGNLEGELASLKASFSTATLDTVLRDLKQNNSAILRELGAH